MGARLTTRGSGVRGRRAPLSSAKAWMAPHPLQPIVRPPIGGQEIRPCFGLANSQEKTGDDSDRLDRRAGFTLSDWRQPGCSVTAFRSAPRDVASSNYPVFKGPAALYVLKMMPDGNACVLTSSNARAGVPSAKRRFPVPNRTG